MKPLAIVSLHASPVASLGSGENGGMNVYVRAVCVELSRRGIATEVFTRRTTPSGPDRLPLAPNSWVTRIRVGPQAEVDKAAVFDLLPELAEAVLDLGRRRGTGYELIHSHYWISGWVAARLRDEWNLPWFHSAHTLARVKNEQATPGAVMEPEHRIAVEQAVVRGADRLIASTTVEADDLARLYGADRSRLSVVPPGVDLRVFTPRPAGPLRRKLGLGAARVIVFAGRLERLKGAETLLRAFSLLTRDHEVAEPLALLILGDDSHNGALESRSDGGEQRRLKALARDLGVLPRVRFLGAVPPNVLARFLSLAEVCVVPSYTESFGLVALEAAACGTPVVAARVGGLPTVVKDGLTGYTLVSHDPAQYAERIARLLHDPELRRCFSRRSQLVASQFTWAETVDRLRSVYARDDRRALEPAGVG